MTLFGAMHMFTCKLLRLLPNKHMVKMIMELVRNRNFTLTTGDSKQSRLRRLKNGVHQGLVLAPLLFNSYTYHLPFMIFRKFSYADYLALLHSSGNWKDLEETLSQDMSTLSAYLQTWRLKLSHTKMVMAAFHLNNRETKHKLKVYNNGRLLPFCPTPNSYLPWGKTGQIAHVSSPLSGIVQKTILARHTAEVTRGLGMGCWC